MFKLFLVDNNRVLTKEWKKHFKSFEELIIIEGDIFSIAENCIVSPANSYGFMDGGIDAEYINYFGTNIQNIVREEILSTSDGFLPVGSSKIIRTGNNRIPFMIIAPTMNSPEFVDSSCSYRAFRAVLRIAQRNIRYIQKIYCPGLATGVGGVNEKKAATEMAQAYKDFKISEFDRIKK